MEQTTSFILVFILTWWIVFFMVLPFGVRVNEEKEEGMADSAPVHPRIGLKVLVTTLISLIFSVIYITYLEPYFLDFVLEE